MHSTEGNSTRCIRRLTRIAMFGLLATSFAGGSVFAQTAGDSSSPRTSTSVASPASTELKAAPPSAASTAGTASPERPAPAPEGVGPTPPPQGQMVKTVTTTVTNLPSSAAPVHTDLPSDLSVQGMFMAADPIVKVVMGLLALASVATWSIFIFKIVELSRACSSVRRGLRTLAEARSLRQASDSLVEGAVARLIRAADLEIEVSEELPFEGIKERVGIALDRVENSESRRVGTGTNVLASVGSTGPFVGLFGTVWGIMNSFIHISNAHTTNLSVVAPGIAEALLATAMGLVAAIPAVVVFNMFGRWISLYRTLLGDCSAAIMRHVSRYLDRREIARETRIAAE